MSKILIVTLVIIGSICVMPASQHNSRSNRPQLQKHRFEPQPQRRSLGLMNLIQRLELNEDQKDILRNIQNDFAILHVDFRADIEKLKINKRASLHEYDFAEAKRITELLYKEKSELRKSQLDMKERMLQVLTEQQKDELRDRNHPRNRKIKK